MGCEKVAGEGGTGPGGRKDGSIRIEVGGGRDGWRGRGVTGN